jgi:hypothetical protein
VVANKTGSPEPVLNKPQWDRLFPALDNLASMGAPNFRAESSFTDEGGSGRGGGDLITNVYNPKPERASTSVKKRLKATAEHEGWNR